MSSEQSNRERVANKWACKECRHRHTVTTAPGDVGATIEVGCPNCRAVTPHRLAGFGAA